MTETIDYVGPWCKVHNQPPDPASKVLFWHYTDDSLPCEWVKHTGSCEDDCQGGCAYPGQFSECEIGAANER